ncbi:MAG: serine hydrolase domain-containing protein [Bacteroidota bacterium]
MKKICLMLSLWLPLAMLAQPIPVDQIQKILDKSVDGKRIFGTLVSLSKEGQTYHFGSGNMNPGDKYFIASISKVYTAAVLFQLIEQGKLSLDDSIQDYLPARTLNGLHLFNGEEYSANITIRHLLTNTSGLPDYFMQKNTQKESLLDYLLSKGDTSLTFDQIIDLTKSLACKFPPGSKGKAYYSDSNFQLLGKIIQQLTGKSMADVYEDYIFKPLRLKQSYLYNDPSDTRPATMYYKKEVLAIPRMMAAFQSDGGIVSTSEENLRFLKAHMNGELFSEKKPDITTGWNKIYSPFQYGYGIMKFKFPGMPDMIGHAGANGSFAYYIPSRGLYLTGTINQIAKPQLVYKLIAKILETV